MSFDLAIRLTEILLAFALIQQSIEHIYISKRDRYLFIPRLILSVLVLFGAWSEWACLALMIHALFILKRFQGPYNGGSDRMSLLILACLCMVHFAPSFQWKEYAFGYLSIQLILSYVVSGWVKITNRDWRRGQALQDVFQFSAYPACEGFRSLAHHKTLLYVMSWAVMLFELLFPLALLTQPLLIIGLVIATIFHLANAFLFGLNRFFWIWLAAYPAIIWFQERVF